MSNIRKISEIMSDRKCDTLFIVFDPDQKLYNNNFASQEEQLKFHQELDQTIRTHQEWFMANGLTLEHCVPDGWSSEESGWHYVNFIDLNDTRASDYSAMFEDHEGNSLRSDLYRLCFYLHKTWIEEMSVTE